MTILSFPELIVSNNAGLSAVEYAKRYTEARRTALRMDIATRRKILAIYREAADEAAEVVRDSLERGLSDLTTERWASLAARLSSAADDIASGVDDSTVDLIRRTASLLPEVDAQHVLSAVDLAGAEADITAAGVSRLVASVSDRVVASLVSRLWADGQTFSERIWGGAGIRGDWLERIRLTVASGIAQGRDPIKIAKDIQVYTADGKVALLQRWGALERGTSEFSKRISGRIDWRATRLVRSELSASLQDSAVAAGQMNPGCDGLFDWVLQTGRESWNCDCEALADGGPYEADQVPTYPHPNCHPEGTMIETMRGSIAIEEIIPGDSVISHDGTIQRVINSWRHVYDGEMFTFMTSEGEISATPEHPLFSNGSWIPSHALKAGGDITRISVDIESLSTIKSIPNNGPTGQAYSGRLFRILHLLSGSGVPITAIDFDGQFYILKGEIDIEPSNGKIWDRLFSDSDDGIIQHAFVGRPQLSGIELSLAGLLFIRYGPTPDGIVSGASISLPPISITSSNSVVDGWERKSETDQVPVDATSRHSEYFSYLIDREVLVSEQLDEPLSVKVDYSNHSSAIVGVNYKKFKGIVYNLSIENTHSFIANGFASHNCFCTIRPHLRDQREFVDDLKKWAAGGDVDYLDKWYIGTYKATA